MLQSVHVSDPVSHIAKVPPVAPGQLGFPLKVFRAESQGTPSQTPSAIEHSYQLSQPSLSVQSKLQMPASQWKPLSQDSVSEQGAHSEAMVQIPVVHPSSTDAQALVSHWLFSVQAS